MKTVVCFGDSNTYGFMPGGVGRFPKDVRWPGVLQKLLGPGYDVVEEGLSGRTTAFSWPDCTWKNGLDNIRPCLASHTPVDVLVIMLGTNDCNSVHGATPELMERAMRSLVEAAREVCLADQKHEPRILIVSPPPIGENYRESIFAADLDAEAVRKSRLIAEIQARVAASMGCRHLDAGAYVRVSDVDSEHLSAESHALLAQKVAEALAG